MICRIICVIVLLAALATNARGDGERIALCVGINKYDDSGFENLEYAQNDATAFAAVLRDVGYKVVLMTTATGKTDPKLAPTKQNLDAQIEALINKRKPDDLIVLALVGHSLQFDKDPDCYFCPVDAKPSRDKTATLVSLDGIYTQLGRCRAGAKVLLADWSRKDQTRGSSPNDVLDKVPVQGVLALFACSANERSYENNKLAHGVFFSHLLEGLKTTNNGNGEVEFLGLAKTVAREVPKTVTQLIGKEQKQNPSLKVPNMSMPVILLTRNDCEILADFRAMKEWRQKNGSSAGYYKENGPKRIAVWKAAAERGSAGGMILYARCLEEAAGVSKDATEATKWYRKAAELGDTDAMFNLGWCYRNGEGVAKDAVEAVKWYRKAAELGQADATYELGGCYYRGEGVAKDAVEAGKWARKAAELGQVDAMFSLGLSYLRGEGVAKDQAEAVKWFRKAAELENTHGMYELGGCYLYGEGVSKDAVEAIKWFRKAAELGNPDGMCDLGCCYREGVGVRVNMIEAVKWFRKAAELGQKYAMYNLGSCYLNGQGLDKDTVEAVKWFHKAADLGLAETKETLKLLGKE